MKHLIKLPFIALLLSVLCIASCSSDADEIYSTNHIQYENISDSTNAISFSDFAVIGEDSLIAQVVEMPARFVSKEEFFSNYHPQKNIAETYSAEEPYVIITQNGSRYTVSIELQSKMKVTYETRGDPYIFPPKEQTKYHVAYKLASGEYAGNSKSYRESELQLSVSIDVYTKAGDGSLTYSRTPGFTVRIHNKKFRLIDYYL